MRLVILIAGVMLAANAMAEEKPKSVTKELDKSSPLIMSTSSPNDSEEATEEKASDLHAEGVVHRDVATREREKGSGMATGRRTHAPACTDGMDNDCDGATDATPANHNTTRANRTLRSAPQSNGNSGGTRAQDYNSSRSNTTTAILDTDSDGDRLEEVRCSRVSDECVDAGNGDDPVVRKKPGKR